MDAFDIDDEFEHYMRRCYTGVPQHSEQYRESRRIFFAGMASTFYQLMKLTALSDEAAEAGLANIEKQLKAFAQRVGQDKD
jgi:hypothetical protein